eukprot:TRINITY_DN10416_c0_g1_i3.p1 TRINITY_DN10416_c0_g1~~TRINITY_DN10416_c0_g1_i3.p1  ORF type:complete len:713 (+),score=61.02 TRINITY_DN10416_c0_g1_i3:152-2290(+)
MAACYLATGTYHHALSEADRCIKIMPSFKKGYLRKATAYVGLHRYNKATSALAFLADDPPADCIDAVKELQRQIKEETKKNSPAAGGGGGVDVGGGGNPILPENLNYCRMCEGPLPERMRDLLDVVPGRHECTEDGYKHNMRVFGSAAIPLGTGHARYMTPESIDEVKAMPFDLVVFDNFNPKYKFYMRVPGLLPGEDIAQISAGGYHYALVTSGGRLFTWGIGSDGSLGHGSRKIRLEPTLVETILEPVKQVSCGFRYTLALGESGCIYATGLDTEGCLGRGKVLAQKEGKRATYIRSFEKVETPDDVRMSYVCAGFCHSMATSVSGELYLWGSNKFGQLGNDSSAPKNRPILVEKCDHCRDYIPFGSPIIQGSLGAHHSCVITSQGEAYTFGQSIDGQLGDMQTLGNCLTVPSLANEFYGRDRIVKISSGTFHTMVLTEKGEVYSWGREDGGGLGTGLPMCIHTSPRKITGPVGNMKMADIACNADHSIALNTKGEIFICGEGFSQFRPVHLFEGVRTNRRCVQQVATGTYSSIAVLREAVRKIPSPLDRPDGRRRVPHSTCGHVPSERSPHKGPHDPRIAHATKLIAAVKPVWYYYACKCNDCSIYPGWDVEQDRFDENDASFKKYVAAIRRIFKDFPGHFIRVEEELFQDILNYQAQGKLPRGEYSVATRYLAVSYLLYIDELEWVYADFGWTVREMKGTPSHFHCDW